MSKDYQKTVAYWDDVFKEGKVKTLESEKSGNLVLDEALDWLAYKRENILDFGSGNGVMLALLKLRNTACRVTGIDPSVEGVVLARKLFRVNNLTEGHFIAGSIEQLRALKTDSFDGCILSNVLDNLKPKHAKEVLEEVARVLKPLGKCLVKLNPFLERDMIRDYAMTSLDQDFYLETSGLFLWNKPTHYWEEMLDAWFTVEEAKVIEYKEYGQENRLFLLRRKEA